MATERKYKSFNSFYPYYLTEHSNTLNRTLHFIGTFLVIVLLVMGIWKNNGWLLAAIPFCGYGFAWIGHFFIEKNKPATFIYPIYSLASDFVMFWHIITLQIGKQMAAAKETIENNS
ncbi:MAG: Mpo1-like protein [Ferruginibacter sp.]